MAVDLEIGDVIFVQRQGRYLGGHPAQITKLLRDAVEVRYLNPLSQRDDRYVELLRDVRCYAERVDIPWTKGDRVFGYVPVALHPHKALYFPGTVQGFHYGMCVEIDFDDATQALVPTTLIEPLRLVAGAVVYVRNDPHAFVRSYDPCRLMEFHENELLVQDIGTGNTMEVHLSSIGILPSGYEMRGEKLVKVSQAGQESPQLGEFKEGIP